MNDVEFLRQIPAFGSLTDEEAAHVLSKAKIREFPPGESIVKKGDQGDAMYIIRSGSVLIPILDQEGGIRFTARLESGGIFGEMALFTGERRIADVLVIGQDSCVCLELQKQEVEALLRQHPSIARFLTEILAKRLLESEKMRIVGKYTLVNRLGRGGTAFVFQGHHNTLDRPVAIKMLSHSLIYNQSFVRRFQTEAQIIANLNHENIIQVYDAEQAYGTFFIVMEKLKGQNLGEVIQAKGPLSPEEARQIIVQTASALQYAHEKGIIHRDIKPANIFVETSGRVKLMDFGIAYAPQFERTDEISEGFMGTPGYVAPEQIVGKPIDLRADIYALGVVAFIMLSGRKPFPAPSTTKILQMQLHTPSLDITLVSPQVPQDIASFIAKATAKEPTARFSSCQEILEHFAHSRQSFQIHEIQSEILHLLYSPQEAPTIQAILNDTLHRIRTQTNARIAHHRTE